MYGMRYKEGDAAKMKMALKDGQVLIKEADSNQALIIKSWGKMKWSKAELMLINSPDLLDFRNR